MLYGIDAACLFIPFLQTVAKLFREYRLHFICSSQHPFVCRSRNSFYLPVKCVFLLFFLLHIYFSRNKFMYIYFITLVSMDEFLVWKINNTKLLVPVGHKWINNWRRGNGTSYKFNIGMTAFSSEPLLKALNSSFWWFFFAFLQL